MFKYMGEAGIDVLTDLFRAIILKLVHSYSGMKASRSPSIREKAVHYIVINVVASACWSTA